MLILTDERTGARCGNLPAVLGAGPWSRPGGALLSADQAQLYALLAPGRRPISARVPGQGFWQTLIVVDESPRSQYDLLRAADPPRPVSGPVAAMALSGSGFHGQQQRPWRALPGNLHLSLAIPCRLPLAGNAAALNALPAVAVVDALSGPRGGDLRPGIKWVNDILIEGRKVAGVLTAVRTVDGQIRTVWLGIGLNVAAAPALPPHPWDAGAACLADFHPRRVLPLSARLQAVLAAVADRFTALTRQGPGPLIEAYRAASLVVGRQVAIWPADLAAPAPGEAWPPPERQGRVTTLTDDLGLVLAGSEAVIQSGRLAIFKD